MPPRRGQVPDVVAAVAHPDVRIALFDGALVVLANDMVPVQRGAVPGYSRGADREGDGAHEHADPERHHDAEHATRRSGRRRVIRWRTSCESTNEPTSQLRGALQ